MQRGHRFKLKLCKKKTFNNKPIGYSISSKRSVVTAYLEGALSPGFG